LTVDTASAIVTLRRIKTIPRLVDGELRMLLSSRLNREVAIEMEQAKFGSPASRAKLMSKRLSQGSQA
jgi:hypothetical protein